MQYIQLQGQNPSEMDTPIDGSYNLFLDGLDGTIKLKDDTGEWYKVGDGLVEITYSELYQLWDDGALTPGTYYKITDFKTCYDQPDYNYSGDAITTGNYREGNISPIIVFSLDQNKLASDAYQPEYPNDNIKYDITFNDTEVTSGPAFGRITYRKDDQGNAFDYDFRDVYFKRYDGYFSESVYDGAVSMDSSGNVTGTGTNFTSTLSTGIIVGILNQFSDPLVSYYEIVSIADDTNMVVTGNAINSVSSCRLVDANLLTGMSWKQNNIISNTNEYEYLTFTDRSECFSNTSTNTAEYTKWDEETFLLSNNVFRGGAYIDNSFGNRFRNNTFNDDCDSNIIRRDFYNNIITNDFDHNTINDRFYDNVIDVDFNNNLIMGSFGNNNLGDDDGTDFENNIIKGSFYNNYYTGYYQFTYNTINNAFGENVILREFSNNTIDSCNSNTFGGDFNRNTIGNSFNTNVIYHDVYDNIIGSEFNENTLGTFDFGSSFQNNHIGSGFKGNLIAGEFDDNKIGYGFVGNEIGSQFNRNNIGYYFVANDIEEIFQDNLILNNFYSNEIGDGFRGNQIGNDFYENNISHNFGFGGSDYRGNVIGNGFNNNEVGEYFYDNTIRDRFEYNTIADDFQFNRVETELNGIDFTAFVGRISAVTFAPTGATGGVYAGLTGAAAGSGVNALFTVNVVGGFVDTVDITQVGKLYLINDTITIASGAFGGDANLVLTVSGLYDTPMVYEGYNKTIQRRFDGTPILTALDNSGGWYISQYITEPID